LIGVVGLLFVAIFWANLWRLWLKTNLIDGTAEWAHATLVPVIGLYYVYLHLDEIKAQPIKPLLGLSSNRPRWLGAIGTILVGLFAWQVVPQLGPLGESFGSEFVVMGIGLIGLGVLALALDWGLATLLGGLLLSAYGIWPGQNDYVKDVGMVVALFGAVLTMCGWGVMRIVYFPILFLICALPWPGLFYSKLALPLQELASLIGVGVINVLGVEAMKEGTTIWISFPPGSGKDPMPIGVAEACAGLKSLMTFITMGAAIAYLSNRTLWQKLLIVASAIPIAIGCNIFRVAMMGYFTGIGRPEVLSGFTHGIAGLVFLMVPGMALLLGMVWVLDKLVIEEADEEPLVLKKGQS
jgi:exosortase